MVAALGDDAHVDEQRARYAERRRPAAPGARSRRASASTTPRAGSTSGPPTRRTTRGRGRVARRPRYPGRARHVLRRGRRAARAVRADRADRAGRGRGPPLRGGRRESGRRITELWERRAELAEGDAARAARRRAGHRRARRGRGARGRGRRGPDAVVVHEWAKQAILLSFKAARDRATRRPARSTTATGSRSRRDFGGVRVVPGAIVRWGSYIAPGAVLMPSFVNIGGYVDEGTMVDTWATVGSCAQIGKRVHLSGGVGIGGVLEPPQARARRHRGRRLRRLALDHRQRRAGRPRRGARRRRDPHRHDPGLRRADRRRAAARRASPSGAVVVGGTRPRDVPRRRLRDALRAGAAHAAPGERHDKLALNELLREHGVSASEPR